MMRKGMNTRGDDTITESQKSHAQETHVERERVSEGSDNKKTIQTQDVERRTQYILLFPPENKNASNQTDRSRICAS